jgi:calpain
MVAMMDVDRSGKLGFEEFKALWVDIRHWKVKLQAKGLQVP